MAEFNHNNEVPELKKVSPNRYENLFKVGQAGNHFYYNINKKVNFPDNLDPDYIVEVIVNARKPLTALADQEYGDQSLWWLICSMNGIADPTQVLDIGTKLKILRRELLQSVLDEIQRENNS